MHRQRETCKELREQLSRVLLKTSLQRMYGTWLAQGLTVSICLPAIIELANPSPKPQRLQYKQKSLEVKLSSPTNNCSGSASAVSNELLNDGNVL